MCDSVGAADFGNGRAVWESAGQPVLPASLYLAQRYPPVPEPEPEPEPEQEPEPEVAPPVVPPDSPVTPPPATPPPATPITPVAPPVAPAPAPPPQSKLTAQATYTIDLTAISAGTSARVAFETEFKASVTTAMGGSTTSDDVMIISIAAGSVVVDFHVTVPTVDVSAATATFATNIQNNPAALTITGAVPAVTAPVVIDLPPPPPPPTSGQEGPDESGSDTPVTPTPPVNPATQTPVSPITPVTSVAPVSYPLNAFRHGCFSLSVRFLLIAHRVVSASR